MTSKGASNCADQGTYPTFMLLHLPCGTKYCIALTEGIVSAAIIPCLVSPSDSVVSFKPSVRNETNMNNLHGKSHSEAPRVLPFEL